MRCILLFIAVCAAAVLPLPSSSIAQLPGGLPILPEFRTNDDGSIWVLIDGDREDLGQYRECMDLMDLIIERGPTQERCDEYGPTCSYIYNHCNYYNERCVPWFTEEEYYCDDVPGYPWPYNRPIFDQPVWRKLSD